MSEKTITIDGRSVPFEEGQTIMDAAMEAGIYIPHLCHNPEFKPHGSCKLCTVKVNGRNASACTMPAMSGQEVLNSTEELASARRMMTELLFVEGNHLCPGCEKTGNCELQAVAYHLNMLGPRFDYFYPQRKVDASHPDVWLDRNRCILCELCVRASRDADGKNVFAIAGRGINARLAVNSPSGKLGDSVLAAEDKANAVCPVGALLVKRRGFKVPIGSRTYDNEDIAEVALRTERPPRRKGTGHE